MAAAGSRYNLLVIGGGSGGIACARRSAQYGARVGLIEGSAMGGTCVNVGCVPKKVMYNAAVHAEALHDAASYGFTTQPSSFNLAELKRKRDAYIQRLNGIYDSNLAKSGVTVHNGHGKFVGPKTVQVGSETLTADHILIAVGGQPTMPEDLPGIEHCISSDGFFQLDKVPEKVAVVGAGYIAVEMAGILHSLHSNVHMFIRQDTVLRTFDESISTTLTEEMKKTGVVFHTKANLAAIAKGDDGKLTITLKDGSKHEGFDECLMAIGRSPRTTELNLQESNVVIKDSGHIVVDDFQNTSCDGVYAIGDVTGRAELTPVAIAAGRRLAARLFQNQPESRLDYSGIPTVVFSHPSPIGTCGMTEKEAKDAHGEDKIKIYTSKFTNMFYSMMEPDRKPISLMKMICLLPDEKVLGIHILGMGADEMLQGFGVAMKMGATKKDFDSCVAIHPTAAEELVTMV